MAARRAIVPILVLVASFVSTAAVPADEITVSWIWPHEDLWSNATRWSPAVVPYNTETDRYFAIIDPGWATSVIMDQNAWIDSLRVGPGDALHIGNYKTLFLDTSTGHGNIHNDGEITLNSTGHWTKFHANHGEVTLSGNGAVIGRGTHHNAISASNGGALVNGPNHSIRGNLQLGSDNMPLTNAGLVCADASGYSLIVDPDAQGMTNTGVFRAENQGILWLRGGEYENPFGTIEALASSFVDFTDGVAVIGGLLRTFDDGLLRVDGDVSFVAPVIDGRFSILDGGSCQIEGSIENRGSISLEGAGNWTYFRPSNGVVTLWGGGELVGSTNEERNGVSAVTGGSLVNAADHTIRGVIQVGRYTMGIENHGLIVADHPGGVLQMQPSGGGGGLINTGIMRSELGGVLQIHGDCFNSGLIEAGFGSTVNHRCDLTGGILRCIEGGEIIMSLGSLTDVRMEGDITLEEFSYVYFEGDIENTGVFSVEGASTGWCVIDAKGDQVRLHGGGELVGASNGPYNFIEADYDCLLINDSDHTLRGTLSIGNTRMNLANHGDIIADGVDALSIEIHDGSFINHGLLHASRPAGLQILDARFDQYGQVEISTGSQLRFEGEFVQNEGHIRLDGRLEMNGVDDVVELRGGSLSASGRLVGDIDNLGGTIVLGDSIGTMEVAGNFSQGDDGVVTFDIGGPTPGTQHDVLTVWGSASLGGHYHISIVDGFTPSLGDSFVVLSAWTVNGDFVSGSYDSMPANLAPRVEVNPMSVVVHIEEATAVDDTGFVFEALSVYPNPAAGEPIGIRFSLAEDSESVNLSVYDINGRLVRTLIDGGMAAGPKRFVWDERHGSGHRAASGVYFLRLRRGGGATELQRVTLLR